MVPFESLGTVSNSHSIETMAISLAVSMQYTNVTGTQRARRTPHDSESRVCFPVHSGALFYGFVFMIRMRGEKSPDIRINLRNEIDHRMAMNVAAAMHDKPKRNLPDTTVTRQNYNVNLVTLRSFFILIKFRILSQENGHSSGIYDFSRCCLGLVPLIHLCYILFLSSFLYIFKTCL